MAFARNFCFLFHLLTSCLLYFLPTVPLPLMRQRGISRDLHLFPYAGQTSFSKTQTTASPLISTISLFSQFPFRLRHPRCIVLSPLELSSLPLVAPFHWETLLPCNRSWHSSCHLDSSTSLRNLPGWKLSSNPQVWQTSLMRYWQKRLEHPNTWPTAQGPTRTLAVFVSVF